MAQLTVDYYRLPNPVSVLETELFFLDRTLFTSGADDSISRAPSAPFLRHMDGRWWLVNGARVEARLTVFPATEGRRFTVSERCAFPLPDGESEIYVWDAPHRLSVTVRGSRVDHVMDEPDGNRTVVALPNAVEAVENLFERKPRHKAVLAAYYREYFTPGIDVPSPLDRELTRSCMGLPSNTALERALNDITAAIWGESQGRRRELPRFLIRESLLVARDQGLVPHRDCDHLPGLLL